MQPRNPLYAPDIGARIRSMREQRKISRERLAATFATAMGTPTTTNTLARWESKGNLKVQELIELSRLLECDPAWLLLGDDALADLLEADKHADAEDARRRALEDDSELSG